MTGLATTWVWIYCHLLYLCIFTALQMESTLIFFVCLFSIYRVGGNGQNTSRKFLRFVLRNILKFVNCNDNTKSNHNKL